MIKNAFRLFEEESVEAGVEGLLSISHPHFEYRPFSATGRVLHGPEEAREFFLKNGRSDRSVRVSPQRFEEEGELVIVSGSIRVHHESGGFSETQVRWTYRFRDGLMEEASWEPRYGSAAGTGVQPEALAE